jgi:ABC-type Mn2+/Zn2+ transport system permease subunit
VGIGVVSTVAGLFLSCWLNLASGATIVLFAGVLFCVSLLYVRLRGV